MFANPMPVSKRTVGAQGDVMNGPKEHDECGCWCACVCVCVEGGVSVRMAIRVWVRMRVKMRQRGESHTEL